jgi:phage shock protein PspC (stress-responsive transcriptional regulator)
MLRRRPATRTPLRRRPRNCASRRELAWAAIRRARAPSVGLSPGPVGHSGIPSQGDGVRLPARYAGAIDNLRVEMEMTQSDELARLADLHRGGALTDDEFVRAKARVLSGAAAQDAPALHAINVLRRSADDRWLGGVCGGIAQITGVPSWVWRLLFTVLVLFAGTGILIYLLLWFFVPLAPERAGANQGAV